MIRLLVAALIAGCGHRGEATSKRTTPPVTPRAAERAAPGYRLSLAARTERGLEVPNGLVEGRDAFEGIFPSPAHALEERWVLDAPQTVCWSAFYASDVSELHGTHSVFHELVGSLAGDDRVRESKLSRDGLRLVLRREQHCIYHECKPPLSPPTVTLDVCDDHAAADPATTAETMLGYVPSLALHAGLLKPSHGVRPTLVSYRRDRSRDEVQLTLDADAKAQEHLRGVMLEIGLAKPSTIEPGRAEQPLEWALDSTDPRRSYIFYPPGASRTVQFIGRSK